MLLSRRPAQIVTQALVPAGNHRLVLDGVFWIARTGAPWRDLPDHFGNWNSVYQQFRRWSVSGLWDTMLDEPGPRPRILIADRSLPAGLTRGATAATPFAKTSSNGAPSPSSPAQEPQSPGPHRRIHPRAQKHHRALLLKTQTKPEARNPLRQDRSQLHRLRPHRVNKWVRHFVSTAHHAKWRHPSI